MAYNDSVLYDFLTYLEFNFVSFGLYMGELHIWTE